MGGPVTARRVQPLDGQALDDLPDPCRACLFWELGEPRPDPREEVTGRASSAGADCEDAVLQKQAWVTAQVFEGHAPGRVVRVDGDLAAFAIWAPSPELAPRRGPVPSPSQDALLLATLWVDPRHRDGGVGRLLVQAAVKDALRRHLPAVEVYGDRRWRETDCMLPVTWLLHEGFEVAVEHPRHPLLRLDVRRTSRWTDALEHAVEEVLDLLPRRAPSPAPAPEATTIQRP